jgi:hypothetical protein
MHICFIIENAPRIGGGDYAQFKYAEHLALRGHRVTVFAQFRKEFDRDLTRSGSLRICYRGGLPASLRGAVGIEAVV